MLLKYYIYKNETTILNTELFVCLYEVSDLKIGEFKIYIVYIALHMFFKHVISMCVCWGMNTSSKFVSCCKISKFHGPASQWCNLLHTLISFTLNWPTKGMTLLRICLLKFCRHYSLFQTYPATSDRMEEYVWKSLRQTT